MHRFLGSGWHARSGLVLLVLAAGLVGCDSSDNGSSENVANATAGDGGGVPLGGASGADAGGPGSCVVGDTKACTGTFTTPTGTVLQLGPYGSVMEANVGKGFENAIQAGDMSGSAACAGFAGIFMEDPKLTTQLLETTVNGMTIDFSLYTVYRPATWKAGETYPVITWGNGTCAQPEGYAALLRYVASYGYVVIAANSRWVGSGTPAPMVHALDFAAAANADPASPYYQKLDLTKVGAMGHSQGGAATAAAANDPRVLSAIIFNAADTGIAKPYLALSGDADITGATPASMAADINASAVPAAFLYYHNPAGMGPLKGHLVLMLSPDRVTGPTLAWWQMTFRNDADARASFVGATCKLCSTPTDIEYGQHNIN